VRIAERGRDEKGEALERVKRSISFAEEQEVDISQGSYSGTELDRLKAIVERKQEEFDQAK